MMGTLLVVPTEAKTGKFPPSWEGVPPAERSVCYRLIEKHKNRENKEEIEEKVGVGGAGHETKDRNEKKVQTRNNKTQRETQAMLNGNERRDLWGTGKRRGAGSESKDVCNHVCVRERRNKNNL